MECASSMSTTGHKHQARLFVANHIHKKNCVEHVSVMLLDASYGRTLYFRFKAMIPGKFSRVPSML